MMRAIIGLLICALIAPLAALMQVAAPASEPSTAFRAVEIWIDSHDQPLAAYQLEFKATAGVVKIVGIEGGNAEAFQKAPYYDPAAMQQERVIIAAFSTAKPEHLPKGRTRVATIHLQSIGNIQPVFALALTAGATIDGKTISAEAELKDGPNS